jgi:coenzyme F420-dependent glucose-6-phosphate dehydrogenase
MIEIKITYDTDPDLAPENTRLWVLLSLTAEQKRRTASTTRSRWRRPPTRWSSTRSPSVGSCHREPDEAVEKVGEYVSYGLNHLVFHAPGHDQRRFLNFSRGIWPAGCASWREGERLRECPTATRPAFRRSM